MKNKSLTTKYFSAKRVATLAVLTAMGLIMFMVESLFPPLFLPGAKMGLSNIFSMLTLFLLGPTEAFVLVIIRTVVGSMFTGNMSTLMYSLTAGIVSVAVSSVLVQFAYPRVSIVAISVVSAIMHNVTQNVVFCLVSNTPEMFSYMPWLALLGILAGVIVGFAVWFILRAVPARTFAALLNLDLSEPVSQQQQPNSQSESEHEQALKSVSDSSTDSTDSVVREHSDVAPNIGADSQAQERQCGEQEASADRADK